MATILAHIQVKPGTEAAFERSAKALYEATHRLETGVRRYEYWRGDKPGSYYTLLSFDDYNTFLVHQSSDHHEEEGKNYGPLFESIRLEWLDPIQGASPLVSTNMQPLPAGASDLIRRYHEMLPAQVQEWWGPLR